MQAFSWTTPVSGVSGSPVLRGCENITLVFSIAMHADSTSRR